MYILSIKPQEEIGMATSPSREDRFHGRAQEYDNVDFRQRYVEEMARSIREYLPQDRKVTIMDFGAGTGLLTERLAPYAEKIVAVDVSESMIARLAEKASALPCAIELETIDLQKEKYPKCVEGIVSTMTLHHIGDIPSLLKNLLDALEPGGFLALCDIDSEDGTFHTVDSGVMHYGFDREALKQLFEEAGFIEISVADSTVVHKPHGDYPAFILSARRPG